MARAGATMTGTLRRGTALYGAAVLVDRLLALLLLPLLTRSIGEADYGAWVQTLAGAALLLPLVLFALPTAIVRSFSAAGAARRRNFLRLGALVAALLLCAAVCLLVWQDAAAHWLYGDAAHAVLVPALIGIVAADATVEFATAWLRAAGRIGLIALISLLRSVLRYAVLWALVGGSMAVSQWLGWYAACQLALALAVLVSSAKLLDGAAGAGAAPRLRELLAFALPLVLLGLLTIVNASFDRFLLVQLLGLDGVAVYAAAVSLCSVSAVFYSVLGYTLFPVLARHWAEGRRAEAARLTDEALQAFAFLCLPVALALALTGPWLLPLLTTASYRAPLAVFALLGLAVTAFGIYQIMLYALLLAGRSRQVLALAAAAALANVLLNLALAPRFGLAGAAAAAAVSNVLIAALAARLTRQVLDWSFPWARLLAIAWRAALAGLPLALLPDGGTPPWQLSLPALTVAAALYLGLDIARQASVTRRLLPR